MGGLRLLAIRATPEQYLNRQPTVQAVEQPVTVGQLPNQVYYVYVPQPESNSYTILIVVVAGLFVLGVLGIVALALSRRS